MKLTLKTKATIMATALVVVLLAVVGSLQHRQLGRDFLEVLKEQQDALAATVAQDLADKLETHMAVLRHSASLLDEKMLADPGRRQDYLARVSASEAVFDGIAIVALDGEILANEPSLEKGQRVNIRDRAYFQEVMSTGRPSISTPLLTRTGFGSAVLMLAPVFDKGGKMIAVVGGGLNLQRPNLLGRLAQARAGESGHFEVVTTGNDPLYVVHPDPDKLLTLAPAVSRFPGTLISSKPVAGVNWQLRVVIPDAEAMAPVWRARGRLIEQLSALGVGAAFVIWIAMHWLLRPLSTLHAAIRELRRTPDTEVRLDTRSGDERGDLAREFEGLIRELRTRQGEVVAIMEASPLGFFRTDAEGYLTYVNEAYLQMHGLRRDQARDGWLGLLAPEVRDVAWLEWQRAVKRQDGYKAERPLRRPDGAMVWVMVRSAPLFSNGYVDGHVGTVADVTERLDAEKALRVLTTIFDTTPDYVVQNDRAGKVTYMNPALRRVYGWTPDETLPDCNVAELWTAATNEQFSSTVMPALESSGVWVGETSLNGAAGREIQASHLVIAHRNAKGRLVHYSSVMRDISEQVKAKRLLEQQTGTLRSVTEAIPAMISVVGSDYRYRLVNSSFEQWAGATRESIVGHTMSEVLGRERFSRLKVHADKALAGETINFEVEYGKGNDSSFLAISYVPLRLENGVIDGFVAAGQDISEHRLEELRLLTLTQRDGLTGLLNKAGFESHLEQKLSEGGVRDMAILYIDLDHFKPVNDQHGHAVGDQLLQLFATRISGLVRPTDVVARLGGDEFAVVLSGVHGFPNAQTVAAKIVDAARTPFAVGSLQLGVSASVGVAYTAEPATGWRELVARADMLLYQAKEAGRGRQAGALH